MVTSEQANAQAKLYCYQSLSLFFMISLGNVGNHRKLTLAKLQLEFSKIIIVCFVCYIILLSEVLSAVF